MRLLVALLLPCTTAFDVVGWYVGTNESTFPLESIRWEVYSTIRCGYIVVNQTTGEAACPKDAFFCKCQATALEHGKEVTLGPGDGVYMEAYIYNASKNATLKAYGDTYIRTVGPAVRSCGPGVTGVEIDHEGDHTKLGHAGIVSKFEATGYSDFLDRMQKSMGNNYTVSADVGSWGFEAVVGHGDSYPFELTSWVNREIFAANKNLFVNTMSYYWPRSCGIGPWKRAAWFTHNVWGLAKDQINIGIGYYSYNITNSRKIMPVPSGEPGWGTLSKRCPGLAPNVCVCEGVYFASKQMNEEIGAFIKEEGYRGAFPWAANYDSPDPRESLALYLGKGLGIDNERPAGGKLA